MAEAMRLVSPLGRLSRAVGRDARAVPDPQHAGVHQGLRRDPRRRARRRARTRWSCWRGSARTDRKLEHVLVSRGSLTAQLSSPRGVGWKSRPAVKPANLLTASGAADSGGTPEPTVRVRMGARTERGRPRRPRSSFPRAAPHRPGDDMTATIDTERMDRALELARAVRAVTPPNPWVGCVIEAADGTVFEGATAAVGGPHAEAAPSRAARRPRPARRHGLGDPRAVLAPRPHAAVRRRAHRGRRRPGRGRHRGSGPRRRGRRASPGCGRRASTSRSASGRRRRRRCSPRTCTTGAPAARTSC